MNLTVTIFMLCLSIYKGAVCASSFSFNILKNTLQNFTGPSCLSETVIEILDHGIRLCCFHNCPISVVYNNIINGVIERRCIGFQSCNITVQDSRFIYELINKEDNTCIRLNVEVFYVCKEIKELKNMCTNTTDSTYTTSSIYLYSPGYPDTLENQQRFCRCVIVPPIAILIVTVYMDMQFLADGRDNDDMLTFTWGNNTRITLNYGMRQDDVYIGRLKEISLTTHLFPQHHPHGKVLLKLTKMSESRFQIQCLNTVGPNQTTYSPVSTPKSVGHENGDQLKDTSRPLIIATTVGVVLLLGLLIAVSVLIYTNRGRIANYRKTRAKGQQSTPENHQYYNVGVNNVTSSQNQGEYENVDLFGLQQSQVSNIPALLSDPIYTVNDPTTLPQHASIYASLDNTTTYSAAVNEYNQINNPELEAIGEYSGLNSGTRHEQLRPNEYEQLDGNHADIVSNWMHHSQQENSQYAHGNLTHGHGIYYNN